MSMTDQARAYLALRERITAVLDEFGSDTGWHIVESAVRANIPSEKNYHHKVSKHNKIPMITNRKLGELA
jgi:hypothetical protein